MPDGDPVRHPMAVSAHGLFLGAYPAVSVLSCCITHSIQSHPADAPIWALPCQELSGTAWTKYIWLFLSFGGSRHK